MPTRFARKLSSAYRRSRLYGRNYGAAALVRRVLERPSEPTRVERAVDALWGGFSRDAAVELDGLMRSTEVSSAERASAAWELARWYAHGGRMDEALRCLGRIPAQGTPAEVARGKLLLEPRLLQASDKASEARAIAFDALEGRGFDTDLCMTAANTLIEDGVPEHDLDSDERRLALVNHVFQRHGLAPLRKAEPAESLSLDNVAAAPAQGRSDGPRVSVIMPAYNAESTIGYSIRSLLDQTWRNLEVIVVDDASSDDTVRVVEEAAADDERVVLVRLVQNGGSYVASNAGLARATGEYVTTHGADDWSHPQKIEVQMQPLPDVDFVATQTFLVRTSADLRFNGPWRPSETLLQPNVSSLLLPTALVRDLGGWDPVRTSSDTEFLHRLAASLGTPGVRRLLPDVPLSFALDAETTLTHRPETHVRTVLFGMLQVYHAAAGRWHASGAKLRAQVDPTAPRRFPAPAPMLSNRTDKPARYDEVVVADFSTAGPALDEACRRLADGLAAGRRLALFHWPRYDAALRPVDRRIAARLDAFEIDQLVPQQTVEAPSVTVYASEAMEHRLDKAPAVPGGSMQVVGASSPHALANIEALLGPALDGADGLAEQEPALESEA